MGSSTRAVRIPRQGDGASIAVEPAAESPSAAAPVATRRRMPNSAGSSRAFRTFLIFLIGLAAIYGIFLGVAVRSSSASTSTPVEEVLTVAVVVALAVGWIVTLGQAPTAAWVDDEKLVVRERMGWTRRFPIATVRFHVLRTNGVGLFGPEPTEFVEVSTPRGAGRTYLVGANYFYFARPTAA